MKILDRQEAINWIKEIQSGNFDRNDMKDKMPLGSMAEKRWNNDEFQYGMEYGAIGAIMKIFDLTKDDLK